MQHGNNSVGGQLVNGPVSTAEHRAGVLGPTEICRAIQITICPLRQATVSECSVRAVKRSNRCQFSGWSETESCAELIGAAPLRHSIKIIIIGLNQSCSTRAIGTIKSRNGGEQQARCHQVNLHHQRDNCKKLCGRNGEVFHNQPGSFMGNWLATSLG